MNYKTEDGRNPRELEISQISKLLSLITDIIYVGKFNQEIGLNRIESRIVDGKDAEITDEHLIAFFFKTAITRMKGELSQKQKNSLPLLFF